MILGLVLSSEKVGVVKRISSDSSKEESLNSLTSIMVKIKSFSFLLPSLLSSAVYAQSVAWTDPDTGYYSIN